MESWKIPSCKGPVMIIVVYLTLICMIWSIFLDAPLTMRGLVLFWACPSDQTLTQWRTFFQCSGWASPDAASFHEGMRRSAPPSSDPLERVVGWCCILLQSGILGWSQVYAQVCDGVHIQIRHCASATALGDKETYPRISCALPGFRENFGCFFPAGLVP